MNNNFEVPSLQQVFDSVEGIFKTIDLMDNTYELFNNNYIMRYYQNRGITLRSIFIQDMLNWLCFLGWGDGYIDDNEVIFINDILNLNLSQRDVFNVINELDENILTILPGTFQIFIEYEYNKTTNDGIDTVKLLYSLFLITGSYFIACDGNIDEEEVTALLSYMSILDNNIRTFNIRAAHNNILNQI